jgi:hypothetical protein
MEKQLELKNDKKALAAFAMQEDDDIQIDAEDILIPKLLLMQNTSQLVTDEKANFGDIVSSVSKEVVGKKGSEVDIVPLMNFKTWTLFDADDPSQFVASIPFGADNANWNRMDVVEYEGRSVKPFITMNVYVLLASELGKPEALPHLISFRSTSYRAGKQMMNHFLMAKQSKLHPSAYTLGLGATKTQNDKGTFYIYDVSPKGATEPKHATQIRQWIDTLKAGMHKVDEESEFKKDKENTEDVNFDQDEF